MLDSAGGIRSRWLLMLCLLAQPVWTPAWAEAPSLAYDRINLSASAEDEVENDTLTALLHAHREGSDAARLAGEVNADVAWALDQAKAATGIKARTLDYQTQPVYRNQTLTGWRVRQSLRLEGKDAAALSALVGVLQQRLGVDHVGYGISPEQRRQAEERLIAEAIAAFKQRAALVTAQLGRPGYRLVQMDINSGGESYRPQVARASAMALEAAPPLEAGTQTVRITIGGTIELQQ